MTFIDWLASLVSADSRSVGGAIILLALGWVVTSFVRLGSHIYFARAKKKGDEAEADRARLDRDNRLREVITDIVINVSFDRDSIERITDPARIAALKAQIDAHPDDYRPFIAFEPEDRSFDEFRDIRRNLDPELMVACDRYFDLSMLFRRYYEKIASDEFVALSVERKKGALDQLVRLGRDTQETIATLTKALNTSPVSGRYVDDIKRLSTVAELFARYDAAGSEPSDP